ncbi:hypothetical protein NHN26_17445, partial [Rhodovulum tesquicola]|uniref:hypothetical protein n=1 Tax=Rhodovulum tesquicola TaxID=540254 RepID=UPI002097317D
VAWRHARTVVLQDAAQPRSGSRTTMASTNILNPNPPEFERFLLACCRFRGHEDKIVTKDLEIGHGKTEVHEGVQV